MGPEGFEPPPCGLKVRHAWPLHHNPGVEPRLRFRRICWCIVWPHSPGNVLVMTSHQEAGPAAGHSPCLTPKSGWPDSNQRLRGPKPRGVPLPYTPPCTPQMTHEGFEPCLPALRERWSHQKPNGPCSLPGSVPRHPPQAWITNAVCSRHSRPPNDAPCSLSSRTHPATRCQFGRVEDNMSERGWASHPNQSGWI